MKYMKKSYITPSGEILTPTSRSKASYLAGEAVANFLAAAGLACECVNVCAAPQVVRYDIRLANIYDYNSSRINKAVKAFEARYNATCTVERSSYGDFAVLMSRAEREPLNLRSVIYTNTFNEASRTSCAVGLDTNNENVIIDIEKAPHVLIAGTTGSGKSVLLNTIICSLLYKTTPLTGRFIMIDPKQVELSIYSKLPHLYKPIVTDVGAAVATLAEACEEMDRRYKVLAARAHKQLSDCQELFPRLYIVIDELADLMLTSKRSVEASIVRIAQLGRAAGIHLIIATQRPTTNIVTGLIKANIPTKIALAVSTITDSTTILNHGGAEKLTGRGDAIIKLPDSIIERRFQTAYTPQADIEAIVEHYMPERHRKGLLKCLRHI